MDARVQGTLRETACGRWDWFPEMGEPVEDVGNPAGAPRNALIIPEWDGDSVVGYERVDTPMASLDGRVNMGLLQVVNSRDDDTDALRESLAAYARDWEHHMRMLNPDGDYTCTPCVVVDTEQHRGLFFQPQKVRDQIPDYNQRSHWAIRGGSKSGTKGEAYLNSNILAWYMGGVDTFVHETLHCLGRSHSNGPNGQEYAGPTCILGGAVRGINGFHALGLGLLGDVAEVSESARFTIAPVEVSPHDLMRVEVHGVKINHGKSQLLLTRRKTKEQSFSGYGDDQEVIYIHSPDNGGWYRVASRHHGIVGGWAGAEGIELRNHGGGAVEIVIDGKKAPPADPVEPLPVVKGDRPSEAHSAIWHDPRFQHQGFDLTFHDGRMTGYFFGHHPRGPHSLYPLPATSTGRRWLMLRGTLMDGYVDLEIESVIDGDTEYEGGGTIRFDGDTAFLRMDTSMYGREHYRLARLTPTKRNARIHSIGDDSGISVAEYHGELTVYWFGPGLGGHDWRIMSGPADALKVLKVDQRHRSTHPGKVIDDGEAQLYDDRIVINGRELPFTERLL